MASFDENGKYIKTNWKAGDKITATKLNKIEESIEAVNDIDISRHVEADTRLDALEAKDVAHDKEFTNIKNTIADNKAAAELGDYEINSRMQFLEEELNEGIEEVHNVAETVDGKIATAEANMTAQVNQGKADMEAMVAEVESEMIELQNDMTNAQTQTFTVTDAYKFTVDHDGMLPSLVTLNNIEGQSEIVSNNEGSKYLHTTDIKSICTIDTSKNYLDYATYEDRKTTHSIDGYNINVVGEPGWSYVVVHIYNLEIGNKYCITLDAEVTSGNSALEIVSGFQTDYTIEQCVNSSSPRKSANSMIGVYDGGEAIIRLHASLDTTAGNVTYKNIQINKVKEMIVPDIQLNSLPNGVKDEIKDGMLIKRTKHVNLADLTWVPSVTNAKFPESDFVIYYTHSTPDLIVDPDAMENELGHILCNNIPSVPIAVTWSADPSDATYNKVGISGHKEKSELRIKLYRTGVPDLASLYTWLTNNKVYAVYELETPECIPVNLTIKADKGDTVVINTTKTIDLTYDIQLNTRAQIDALQEQSQTINENLNSFMNQFETSNIAKNGYYVLPGGLMLQWGTISVYFGDAPVYRGECMYNVPFKDEAFSLFIDTNGFGHDADGTASSHNIYSIAYQGQPDRFNIEIKSLSDTLQTGTISLSWFAIGY